MLIQKSFDPNSLERILPWVAFAFVLLIYLFFPTRDYYWDGVAFAAMIEDAPNLNTSLLHPNHLFYNVIGYLALHSARFLSPSIRALEVLQILNSILSVCSAAALFCVLKKIFRQTYPSLALSLLFAFSAAWWKFSTDADAYIPSTLFLIISFYLILPGEKPRPFSVALTHTLAMFLHQLAVLFFPVVILGLIWQTASLEKGKRLYLIIQYALTAFVLTFGIYCFSFYLLHGTFNLKDFFHWASSFSSDTAFSFDIGKSFSLTLRSTSRLFLAGKLGFLELNFLTYGLLVILAVSVIAFFYLIGRNLGVLKTIYKTIADKTFYASPILALCLIWIIPYLLFLFLFIPENIFYRLFYFPAFILILGLLLARSDVSKLQIRQWRLALLVMIVFLSNFLFFIYFQTQIRADTPLSLALAANRQWPDKTVIYYDLFTTENWLFKYYNPAVTWVKFDSVDDLEVKTKEIYARGGTVWIDNSVVEKLKSSNSSPELLPEGLQEASYFELNDRAYKIKFIQIAPANL